MYSYSYVQVFAKKTVMQQISRMMQPNPAPHSSMLTASWWRASSCEKNSHPRESASHSVFNLELRGCGGAT